LASTSAVISVLQSTLVDVVVPVVVTSLDDPELEEDEEVLDVALLTVMIQSTTRHVSNERQVRHERNRAGIMPARLLAR
jgi:hypothetical protein